MKISIFMKTDKEDILDNLINLYGRKNIEINVIDNKFYYVKIKEVSDEDKI